MNITEPMELFLINIYMISIHITDNFYESRIFKLYKHIYTIKPDACLNFIDAEMIVSRSRQTRLSHFLV